MNLFNYFRFVSYLFFALFTLDGIAQVTSNSFSFDGRDREYLVYTPSSYSEQVATPLVLVLHGLGDSGNGMMAGTGFNAIADTANFIVSYPTASNGIAGAAWNNGIAVGANTDDIGFLSAIIDSISDTHNIDPQRVYVTGFSMGGFMTQRLACELNERFAAFASVSGPLSITVHGNCEPGRSLPLMHIHGTSDAVVPYEGNALFGMTSVVETFDLWTTNNECFSDPELSTLPDTFSDGFTVDFSHHNGCVSGDELRLYTVNGADHIWPQANNDIHASSEIWNFFTNHVLPEEYLVATNIEEAVKKDFAIFPNPAINSIKVVFEEVNESAPLTIVNSIGQIVYSASHNSSFQLNVSSFTQGLYFLHYQGTVKSFVKN